MKLGIYGKYGAIFIAKCGHNDCHQLLLLQN